MTAHNRIGTSFEECFPALGHRVPLRPGTWTLLAEIRQNSSTSLSADAFLGRIEEGRLHEVIRVWTSVNVSGEKQRYGAMLRHDNELYRVVEQDEESGGQSAWIIKNVVPWPWKEFHDLTTGITHLEALAGERMAQMGTDLPEDFLVTQFVLREPSKFLQVSYYVSPTVGHPAASSPGAYTSWQHSGFAPLNIRRNLDKFTFFQGVVAWSASWWPQIKSCFQDFHSEGF